MNIDNLANITNRSSNNNNTMNNSMNDVDVSSISSYAASGTSNRQEPKSNSLKMIVVLLLLVAGLSIIGAYLFHHPDSPKAMKESISSELLKLQGLKQISSSLTQSARDIAADGVDDTVTDVVTCETTQGNLIIDVRRGWAPLGAQQFIKLVDSGFFEDLPFFRVCPKYITQFGAKYKSDTFLKSHGMTPIIKDDPTLWDIRDIDYGYLFFAGSGAHSRREELVIALCDMKGCKGSALGHEPWEVPVGTIRKETLNTLHQIANSGYPYPKLEMPGLHEKAAGPLRHKLDTEKNYLLDNFPQMEYFRSCNVAQRDVIVQRPLYIDHPDTAISLPKSRSGEEESQQNQSKVNGKKSAKNKTKAKVKVNSKVQAKSVYQVNQLDAPASASAAASSSYVVKLTVATEKGEGEILIEIRPDWAPLGAAHLKELVENQFYSNARFFRVIKHFVAQFGINAEPEVHRKWTNKVIKDDPVKESNRRGTLTYATSGPNTRSTQLFFNFADNTYLDSQGFAPIGRVTKGMDVVDAIYDGYGEGGKGDGSDGKGPGQGKIVTQGNKYLEALYPKLSFIVKAEIVE